MILQREKKYVAGKILEVELFPIFEKSGKLLPTRSLKDKESSAKQKKLNEKNSRKKLQRMLDTNFISGKDVAVHFTYRDEDMPADKPSAMNDAVNFFRRMRYYFDSVGAACKYVYVPECKVSKKTGLLRWHFHGAMTALDKKQMIEIFSEGKKLREKWIKMMTECDPSYTFEIPDFRDFAEKMWSKGDYPRVEKLKETENGFEALGKYMTKGDTDGGKRWIGSKNLSEPETPPPEDGKFSARDVEEMARTYNEDKSYFEKLYDGYDFVRLTEREYNDYNGYWYLTVRMRKKTGYEKNDGGD